MVNNSEIYDKIAGLLRRQIESIEDMKSFESIMRCDYMSAGKKLAANDGRMRSMDVYMDTNDEILKAWKDLYNELTKKLEAK